MLSTMTFSSNISAAEEVSGSQHPIVSQVNFYLAGLTLLPICCLGVICNSLVVAVLTRKSMKSSISSFLLALALYDTLLLVCTVLTVCLEPLSVTYRLHVLPQILPYVYPVAVTAQTCTIWITVSFTVERFAAIRYPLEVSVRCTARRAKVICAGISVASVLYNASRWFEMSVEPVMGPNGTAVLVPRTQLRSFVNIPTELGSNQLYERIYYTGLYLSVMSAIPIFLLVTLNSFLILTVHRARADSVAMGNGRPNKEQSTTVMLVVVVLVFILCQVPALVYNVGYGISKQYVLENTSWRVLSIVRNFTVTVNSAVNFILYCAFGQKFRCTFVRLFCWRCNPKRKRQRNDQPRIPYSGSQMRLAWHDNSKLSQVSYAVLADGEKEETESTALTSLSTPTSV